MPDNKKTGGGGSFGTLKKKPFKPKFQPKWQPDKKPAVVTPPPTAVGGGRPNPNNRPPPPKGGGGGGGGNGGGNNNNGGGGGGGGGKKGGKKKKKSKLYRRARRDVALSQQPYLDELKRQRTQTKTDYGQYSNQLDNLYAQLQSSMGQAGAGFGGMATGVSDQYGQQIAELASRLGSAGPAGEQAAAAGLLGNLGAGGLGVLNADTQRFMGDQTANMQASQLGGVAAHRNAGADLLQQLNDLQSQRLDLKSQMGPAIKQRLDELRDQLFNRGLAKDELALRQSQQGIDNSHWNQAFELEKAQAAVDNASTEAQRQLALENLRWIRQHPNGR